MGRYAFTIIMNNTIGARVKSLANLDAQNAARSQAILREMAEPGAFLVDGFHPSLNYHDGCTSVKPARQADPGHQVGALAPGRKADHSQGLVEEDLAGGLVEAGFDTTAATLNSIVMHLAANPPVQKVAQSELVRVAGPGRLPRFADMESLPYVRACVKEMLRINPILAPGIRHYVVCRCGCAVQGTRDPQRNCPVGKYCVPALRTLALTRSSSWRNGIADTPSTDAVMSDPYKTRPFHLQYREEDTPRCAVGGKLAQHRARRHFVGV
ncbi:MAG: hypothetical protein Q9196_003439 [Gyalolechia fulgens]